MLIEIEKAFVDEQLLGGMAIEVASDRTCQIRPLNADTADHKLHLVMPGCTDLQVNGGGGVMVNSDPTPQGLRKIRDAHFARGTYEIMPTVITDHPDVLEAAVAASLACQHDPGLLGLHIEGPHINPKRHGAHAPEFMRPLDDHTVGLLAQLRAAGLPTILTVAPELCDPSLVEQVRQLGVVISAGHSEATTDETQDALLRGVCMFTHLFNAMPAMTSRAPGIVGSAILSDAFCGLIADGHHVAWEMLELAWRARPQADRNFVVSDAMATIGGPDRFTLYDEVIALDHGRLINTKGVLAGAHCDMVTGLRNLCAHTNLDLRDVIAACTSVPRRALGLAPRTLRKGFTVDEIIALDRNMNLVPLVGGPIPECQHPASVGG